MISWLRTLITPKATPYNPIEWRRLPLPQRAKAACLTWADQGFGAPLSIYLFYGFKLVFYIVAWIFFCSLDPQLGSWEDLDQWYTHPRAYQKAIVWSMLFEILGLGCGSGPLTARYLPPFGGALYALRKGTSKLPFFPKVPLIGHSQRGWLDVGLYLVMLSLLFSLLISSHYTQFKLLCIISLLPILGILDIPLFLMARAEHYWLTLICFYWAGEHIELGLLGAMCVQLALWFWAGISKLNPHFPSVIAVMLSNHPLNRSQKLRRSLYRHYPHDLRPSRLAHLLAHLGAASELLTPLFFGLALLGVGGEHWVTIWWLSGLVMGLQLHLFITSNIPMGVPIEWNILIIYSLFSLFYAHSDLSLSIGYAEWLKIPPAQSLWHACEHYAAIIIVLTGLIVLPLIGHLVPKRVSFLLAMRYYAGNWPFSVWLFKEGAEHRLEVIKKSAPWITTQLEVFYDQQTVEGVIGRVMGFRMMHLQGRVLNALLPRAIQEPLSNYRYLDGEVIGGLILGWNFGDGHLHQQQLLEHVQHKCEYLPGELRCIFVESQPLGGQQMSYQIFDAAQGRLEEGGVDVADLLNVQPWEAPPVQTHWVHPTEKTITKDRFVQ